MGNYTETEKLILKAWLEAAEEFGNEPGPSLFSPFARRTVDLFCGEDARSFTQPDSLLSYNLQLYPNLRAVAAAVTTAKTAIKVIQEGAPTLAQDTFQLIDRILLAEYPKDRRPTIFESFSNVADILAMHCEKAGLLIAPNTARDVSDRVRFAMLSNIAAPN